MNSDTTPQRRPTPPPPEAIADDLRRVRLLTRQMRDAESRVATSGRERRRLLRDLRAKNVPFRTLAEAAGTTEHAIYKDLRWGKFDVPEAAIPTQS